MTFHHIQTSACGALYSRHNILRRQPLWFQCKSSKCLKFYERHVTYLRSRLASSLKRLCASWGNPTKLGWVSHVWRSCCIILHHLTIEAEMQMPLERGGQVGTTAPHFTICMIQTKYFARSIRPYRRYLVLEDQWNRRVLLSLNGWSDRSFNNKDYTLRWKHSRRRILCLYLSTFTVTVDFIIYIKLYGYHGNI